MKKQPLKTIAGDPEHKLDLGDGIQIQCYVLENKERVITQKGLIDAFDFKKGGTPNPVGDEVKIARKAIPQKDPNHSTTEVPIPNFLKQRWLAPYISDQILSVMKTPTKFKTIAIHYGYQAGVLIDIANAILTAHQEGSATSRQAKFVKRAQRIVSASAKVGINALIDEVTGYQALRDDQELQKFFDKFLKESPSEWQKTYPDDYYQEIYRLNEWEYPPKKNNHPQVVAHWTIKAVYDRLAPLLTPELEKRNPMTPSGSRIYKHHQFLSDEEGYPLLERHLYAITSLMRTCNTWQEFERTANRAFPIPGTNMEIVFPNNNPNDHPN